MSISFTDGAGRDRNRPAGTTRPEAAENGKENVPKSTSSPLEPPLEPSEGGDGR
jgi:hypothetical protein